MAKVIIYLRGHDLTALNDLAQREYRAPKAQAALIIRRELERLGMIPGEQQGNQNEPLPDARDRTVTVEG
ncbi:MAG: hypothetical protein MUO77_02235 [Anaerolineales bacterium]|nr:hypothetical protein [Anaerolineales bacterium]